MSDSFGIEAERDAPRRAQQPPARWLVIIDAGGSSIARLLLATRKSVGEFDAGAEEVALMTRGVRPSQGAVGAEWDAALEGHSAAERAAAQVYELDV